jgi:hypothetical protein
MKKVIKLRESDLQRIVKKVIKEDSDDESREKIWKDNKFHGFSDKTLIGALKHMMKIRPYDLERIEELKNLSREELEAKLTKLKGW